MPASKLALNTTEVSRPLTRDCRDAIDRLIGSKRGAVHFRQTPAWLEIAGSDPRRLFISRADDGTVLASSILSESRGMLAFARTAEIVRGPIARDADTAAAHLEGIVECIGSRYTTLRVNPYIPIAEVVGFEQAIAPLGFRRSGNERYYTHTIIVDVLPSAELQWQQLRRSTRTAINKAGREGLGVRQDVRVTDFRGFAREYSRFARQRGLEAVSERMAHDIFATLVDRPHPLAFLLSADLRGELQGQILLLRTEDMLIYEWGWTTLARKQHRLPISHDLFWHALDLSRRIGCRYLDLGGYWADRPVTDPSNQFKLGFGKTIVGYSGTYERICAPTRHAAHALASRWWSSFGLRKS